MADHAVLIEAGEVCVLTENEEILGVLMMRSQKDHLFVETVAVWPQRQGEGIGRKLMAFAEERARELGLQEVRLYTNEKMRENLPFYRRLGFEETERGIDEGYRRVFTK